MKKEEEEEEGAAIFYKRWKGLEPETRSVRSACVERYGMRMGMGLYRGLLRLPLQNKNQHKLIKFGW